MVKQTIKIFCRVKPTKGKTGLYEVDEEESGGPKLSFFVPKDQSQIVNNTKEEYNFRFQRVFEQQTKQEEVFEHVAQPVVDNAISGYNGTIFAYGQTGSGKTFTITGGAERYADRGIIPRTLSYLFEYYEKHPEFTYTTHVSYLEIYNESGYDLLDPKHEAAKLEDLPKVSLMEDTDQNIHLKNLSVHQAMNEEEALNLLFLGDTNRMIAETPMNQASTRSHCIFTIHLTAREPGSATIRRSKLHLVDLAGSERVGKTGVGGTLLAEAKYINLSLHYLEQVIVALSEKARSHIPYRNSMMTSVLRDSLGGNCMTTMIATCSVEKKNIDESISTCRFAQRVALIKNDALLNEEVDPKLMVLRLKKEIVELKDQLSLATGEQITDDLSGEDMDRLHQMVKGYVEDTDPDATLPVGADMRKINECFRIFKRLVLERHAGKAGVTNGAVEEEEEPSVSEDSGLGSAPSTAGSAEVKKLKDLLQQRDNEINILVNMLKKEKKRAQDAALLLEERGIPFHTGEGTQPNGPGRPPSSRSKHRNREERSRESVSVSRSLSHSESREKETTPPYSQSTTVRLRKIGGEMSVGRQEAFEIFKRDYEHSVTIDDQKSLLKQRYSEAKQLGEKVNSSRAQINHVKSLIQQHRMARAAQGISENVGFSEEPDEEEQHLRQQMEDEKDSYKVTYNRLRVLKTEIEHLQHLLEKARLQMQKDFELWWAEQTVNAHAPKPPQEPPAAWKTPPISPINPPQHPSSRKMAANFSINPTQEPGPSHVHQGGSSRRNRHGSFTDSPTADGEPIRASNSYHGNLDAVGLDHHGNRRHSSHSDSSSSHGRVPRHREVLEDSRSAAPAIPLTGDARADADIMAFFKARQKILQQQGKR